MALNVRFGVGSDTEPQSSVWSFFTNKKGDVYLSMRQLGGVWKYSLHASGICRAAFTQEHVQKHGNPASLSDRVMFKWNRPPTPVGATPTAAFVVVVSFPTDFLSAPRKPDKPVRWIAAAPPGESTFVGVVFSNEKTAAAAHQLESLGYVVAASEQLSSGESVLLVSKSGPWDNDDLTVPGETQDLRFLHDDPHTGRPIRILLGGPAGADGGLTLTELGGYAENKKGV